MVSVANWRFMTDLTLAIASDDIFRSVLESDGPHSRLDQSLHPRQGMAPREEAGEEAAQPQHRQYSRHLDGYGRPALFVFRTSRSSTATFRRPISRGNRSSAFFRNSHFLRQRLLYCGRLLLRSSDTGCARLLTGGGGGGFQ